jgi:glycosyltransferase involved in cell wall biosynthesis
MQKYDNVIKAWLDGETIQRYDPIDDVWVSSVNEWLNPKYFYEYDWRIKPNTHTLKIPTYSNISNVNAYFDKVTREIVIEYEEEAL